MSRNSLIRYSTPGAEVEARVLTIHRDGTVTVEPRFFVQEGRKLAGFIGGKVRLLATDCRATA